MTKKDLEILSDQEYVKSLLDLKTPEEMQKSLEGRGADLTIDEINRIMDTVKRCLNNELTEQEKNMLKAAQENDAGELSDDELENVSGGILVVDDVIFWGIIGCVAGVAALIGGYLARN